ncbi:hypothetical protein C790_02249 [Morganella morganii SC01]|nr:hypothetical protein C790_02249 [Morganella morganii SC01]
MLIHFVVLVMKSLHRKSLLIMRISAGTKITDTITGKAPDSENVI